MTTAALKKAWNDVLHSEQIVQYDNLDAEFMENLRTAVEKAYLPLIGTGDGADGKKGKKKKDRAFTPYNMYVREFSKVHKADPPVMDGGKVVPVFKLASDAWKALDANGRAPYVKRAQEENAKRGVVATADKPKKPPTAYNLFVQDYKKSHPNLTGGKALFKEAPGAWAALDAVSRAAYQARADALKNGHAAAAATGGAAAPAPVAAVAPTAAAAAPAPVEAKKQTKAAAAKAAKAAAEAQPVVEAKVEAPPKVAEPVVEAPAPKRAAAKKAVKA